MSDREDKKHIDAIEPDTYMGLSQQYIKDEISDEEFAKRCNRLKRIPINTYVSIFRRGTKMNRKEIKRRAKC